MAKKTLLTRSSKAPLRSKAAIVFSNVGAERVHVDRADLLLVLLHRLFKGRPVMLQLDRIKRWYFKRCRPAVPRNGLSACVHSRHEDSQRTTEKGQRGFSSEHNLQRRVSRSLQDVQLGGRGKGLAAHFRFTHQLDIACRRRCVPANGLQCGRVGPRARGQRRSPLLAVLADVDGILGDPAIGHVLARQVGQAGAAPAHCASR